MPAQTNNLIETMLRLLSDLNAPYLCERSFKFVENEVFDNRFLASFRISQLGADAYTALSHICDVLNIPAPFRSMIASRIREADNLHLGLEESSDTFLYKLYLEFAKGFRQAIRNADEVRDPVLLHLAFKWEPGRDSVRTTTRYTCSPGLSKMGIQGKLSSIYEGRLGGETHRLALTLLERAIQRMPAENLFFLEVEEENNPRYSFDMCMYDAGFELHEIEPELVRVGQYFRIPPARISDILDPVKQEKLGHLSGGVARSGKEFCTFYYGARLHGGDRFRQGAFGPART